MTESAEILPRRALTYFFEGLEGSLDLTPDIKEEITVVFQAVRQISRELKPGTVAVSEDTEEDPEDSEA